MKHLTLESVSGAMLGNGISFKDVYYPDLIDCVEEPKMVDTEKELRLNP